MGFPIVHGRFHRNVSNALFMNVTAIGLNMVIFLVISIILFCGFYLKVTTPGTTCILAFVRLRTFVLCLARTPTLKSSRLFCVNVLKLICQTGPTPLKGGPFKEDSLCQTSLTWRRQLSKRMLLHMPVPSCSTSRRRSLQ